MFRSFLDHHQVHKELKYATCNKIILVRNGIILSLHFGKQWDHIEFTFWYTMGSHWVYILVHNGSTLSLHFGTQWDHIEFTFWYAMGSHWFYILVRSGIPLS